MAENLEKQNEAEMRSNSGYVDNCKIYGLYDINTFFQIEVVDNILDNSNLLENNEEYD